MVLFGCFGATAQDVSDAVQFHGYSSRTSFPDTGGTKGHIYDGKLYNAKKHYNDSTVLIVAPKNLNTSKGLKKLNLYAAVRCPSGDFYP